MRRVLSGNAPLLPREQSSINGQTHLPAAEAPQPAAAVPGQPASPQPPPSPTAAHRPVIQEESILDQEISQALKVVRAVGGFLGLLFGALLFRVTMTEAPSPLEAFLMIAYLLVAIFWILTYRTHMPLRRFLLELVLFVAATMALKAGNPQVFDGETRSGRRPALVQPSATASDEDFQRTVARVVNEAQALLEGQRSGAQDFKDACQAMESTFDLLDSQAASAQDGLHHRVMDLKEATLSFENTRNPASRRKATFLVEDLKNTLGQDAPR
jgi:hypothetical protein